MEGRDFSTFYDTLYTPLIKGDEAMVELILKGAKGCKIPPVPVGYLGPIILQNSMSTISTKKKMLRLLHESGLFDLFEDKTWHQTATMFEFFYANSKYYTSVAELVLSKMRHFAETDAQKRALIDIICKWPGNIGPIRNTLYVSDELLIYALEKLVENNKPFPEKTRRRFRDPALFDAFVEKHNIKFATPEEKEEILFRNFRESLKRLRDET